MENRSEAGKLLKTFREEAGLTQEGLINELTDLIFASIENEDNTLKKLGAETKLKVDRKRANEQKSTKRKNTSEELVPDRLLYDKADISKYESGTSSLSRRRALLFIYFFNQKGVIELKKANQFLEYLGYSGLSGHEPKIIFGDEVDAGASPQPTSTALVVRQEESAVIVPVVTPETPTNPTEEAEPSNTILSASPPESIAIETPLPWLKQQRPPRPKWAVWGVTIPVLIILVIWLRYGLFSPSATPPVAEQTLMLTATDLAAVASPLAVASLATATPIPTSTATPVSVIASLLTPIPIPTVKPDETLILIATFHGKAANEYEPHVKIRREIEEKIKSLGESNVRVALETTVLNADERTAAEALGKWYGASMVIWGEDTGVEVIVNYLNLREPNVDAADVTINTTDQFIQLANPDVYAQFITKALPDQLSFFSLFAIGQSYYIDQDYERAATIIEEAIDLSTTKMKPKGLAEAYFRLGWLYHRLPEHLDQAITYYSNAIELKSDFVTAYTNRGNALKSQGELNEAITDYNKAIELKSDFAAAYNNRGNTFKVQEKFQEAISDFNRAIEIEPDNAIFHYNRGNTYYEQGQVENAITDLSKAIELNRAFAEAYNNRGMVLAEQRKFEDAIADYTEAIGLKEYFVEAYNNRGVAYTNLGKLEEAFADLNKAIELQPELADAYYNRGNAYYNQGDLYKAIADYSQAIQLNSNYFTAYYDRATAFRNLGNLNEAITDYNKAIELKPDYDPTVYLNRGRTLKELSKLNEALLDFQHYLELVPDVWNRSQIEQSIAEIEAELAKQEQP